MQLTMIINIIHILPFSLQMAFVSQADRGIDYLGEPLYRAAPGLYEIGELNRRMSHSYAPFCSTSLRKEKLNTEVPGPGSYNNAGHLNQPSLTTYSNNSNIIIKLNTIGTPPFQSKQKRFNDNIDFNPGPGQYSLIQQNASRTNSNQRVKANKLFNGQKKAPSISKTIYLSERRTKTEERSDDMAERRGLSVADWSKNKIGRFDNHYSPALGPGTYDLTPNKKQTKKTKAFPSNFFMSNTVRTFDTIVYQAKNRDTLEMREMKHFKTEQPAPGSYNVHMTKLNQSEKYKNKTFGSTEGRFQKAKTEEDICIPFYEVDKSYEPHNFHKKTVSFNSQSKKMSMSLTTNPGPGYYCVQNRSKQLERRSIQHFGSTVQKSPDEWRGNANLGPGYYQTSPKKWQIQKQSVMFASKIPRAYQVSSKTDHKFATYDLSKEDISRRVLEKKIQRDNLEKIECGKPAFDKQTPRFRHYDEDAIKEPPPTKQQIESFILEKKKIERQVLIERARQQVNVSREGMMARGGERFKPVKKSPGVGEYTIRNNWTKKSYNIKYGINLQ